jgi:hypothetical protein
VGLMEFPFPGGGCRGYIQGRDPEIDHLLCGSMRKWSNGKHSVCQLDQTNLMGGRDSREVACLPFPATVTLPYKEPPVILVRSSHLTSTPHPIHSSFFRSRSQLALELTLSSVLLRSWQYSTTALYLVVGRAQPHTYPRSST